MNFSLLINLKLLNITNYFLLNIAEHDTFSANKSQLLAIRNSFLFNIAEHEYFFANKYENAY